jgi:hypothetical protein
MTMASRISKAVGAFGHVPGQAEEVERGQRAGRAVARQGADEARYGDEELLQPHKLDLSHGVNRHNSTLARGAGTTSERGDADEVVALLQLLIRDNEGEVLMDLAR